MGWTSPADKVLAALQTGPKTWAELMQADIRTAALGVATRTLIEDGKIKRTTDGGYRLA